MTDIKMVYPQARMNDADKAVDTACGSWQKAQKDIQVALVSILYNQYKHRDGETTLKRFNRLVEGVKGVNTTAIVEWGVRMGFSVADDASGFDGCPSQTEIEELAGKGFINAKQLFWWSLKPIKPFDGYNLTAKIDALVAEATKKMAQAETWAESDDAVKVANAEKIVVDADQLARLKAVNAA